MRLSIIFIAALLLVLSIGCTGKDPTPPFVDITQGCFWADH